MAGRDDPLRGDQGAGAAEDGVDRDVRDGREASWSRILAADDGRRGRGEGQRRGGRGEQQGEETAHGGWNAARAENLRFAADRRVKAVPEVSSEPPNAPKVEPRHHGR